MAKKLINRLTRTETQQNSKVEPDVLRDYSVGAFLTDEENRTLWVNGMPYGNAYISSSATRQPKHGEVFNNFDNNKAEGHYSHAEGGAYVNTVYNNAKITQLETPITISEVSYNYSVPYTSVLNKMINVMTSSAMNIPLYVVANNENRLGSKSTQIYIDSDNIIDNTIDIDNTPDEVNINSIVLNDITATTYSKANETKYYIISATSPTVAQTKTRYIYFNVATSFNSAVTTLPTYCDGKTMYFHYYYAYDGSDGWSEATKDGAHAEGISQAHGVMAHSEGFANRSCEDYSHTEGVGNEVYGLAAHAEGDRNIVTNSAPYAHAEGHMNIAKADSVHVEGRNNLGNNTGAHVEGGNNIVHGIYGHAEGKNNIVYKECGHAEGLSTIASNIAEHAEGKYNYSFESDNFISTIGIGADKDNRKNAVSIKDDGRIYISSTEEIINDINVLYDPCLYSGKSVNANSKSLQQILANVEEKMQNITYAELVNYIDNKALTPGKFYRITDYCTQLKQEYIYQGVKSAGNAFDIIVLALSNKTISENAWAIIKNTKLFKNREIQLIEIKGDNYVIDITNNSREDTYNGPTVQLFKLSKNANKYEYTKGEGSDVTIIKYEEVDSKGVKIELTDGTQILIIDKLDSYGISNVLILHDKTGNSYIYNYRNFLKKYILYNEVGEFGFVDDFSVNSFVLCTFNEDENTYTIDCSDGLTTIFLDIVDIANNEPIFLTEKYINENIYHYNNYNNYTYNLNSWKIKYSKENGIFTDNIKIDEHISLNTTNYNTTATQGIEAIPTDVQNGITYYKLATFNKSEIIKSNNPNEWPICGFNVSEDTKLFTKYNYKWEQVDINCTNTLTYCILTTYKKPLYNGDKNYEAVICEKDNVSILKHEQQSSNYNNIAFCNYSPTNIITCNIDDTSINCNLFKNHVYNGIRIKDDIDYFGNTVSGGYRYAINLSRLNDTITVISEEAQTIDTGISPSDQIYPIEVTIPVASLNSTTFNLQNINTSDYDYNTSNINNSLTIIPDSAGNLNLIDTKNWNSISNGYENIETEYIAELHEENVNNNTISNIKLYYCPWTALELGRLKINSAVENYSLTNINIEYKTNNNEIIEINGDYKPRDNDETFKVNFYKYCNSDYSPITLNEKSNIYTEINIVNSENNYFVEENNEPYYIFRTLYFYDENTTTWKIIDNTFISDVLQIQNNEINTAKIIERLEANKYKYTFGLKSIVAKTNGSLIESNNGILNAFIINTEMLISDIYNIENNGAIRLKYIYDLQPEYEQDALAAINSVNNYVQYGTLYNKNTIHNDNKRYELQKNTRSAEIKIGDAIKSECSIYNFNNKILYYDDTPYAYYINESLKDSAIICNLLQSDYKDTNLKLFKDIILDKSSIVIGSTKLFGNELYAPNGFTSNFIENITPTNYNGQADEYLYKYLKRIATIGYNTINNTPNNLAANIIKYNLPYYFGRGYIYDFIDEFNNHYQYDVTNIQYKYGDKWYYTFDNDGIDISGKGNIRNNEIINSDKNILFPKNVFSATGETSDLYIVNNRFNNCKGIFYNATDKVSIVNNTFNSINTVTFVSNVSNSIFGDINNKIINTDCNNAVINSLYYEEYNGTPAAVLPVFSTNNFRIFNKPINDVISSSLFNKSTGINSDELKQLTINAPTQFDITTQYGNVAKYATNYSYNTTAIEFTTTVTSTCTNMEYSTGYAYKLAENRYIDLGYFYTCESYWYSSAKNSVNSANRPDVDFINKYVFDYKIGDLVVTRKIIGSDYKHNAGDEVYHTRYNIAHFGIDAIDLATNNPYIAGIITYDNENYVKLSKDIEVTITIPTQGYYVGATNDNKTWSVTPKICGIYGFSNTKVKDVPFNSSIYETSLSNIPSDILKLNNNGVNTPTRTIKVDNYSVNYYGYENNNNNSVVSVCTDGIIIKNSASNFITAGITAIDSNNTIAAIKLNTGKRTATMSISTTLN